MSTGMPAKLHQVDLGYVLKVGTPRMIQKLEQISANTHTCAIHLLQGMNEHHAPVVLQSAQRNQIIGCRSTGSSMLS